MSLEILDIERSRRWVEQHCHHGQIRHILMRATTFLEAVERAGLNSNNTSGDELYEFLTDPSTTEARVRTFVEPTL
ncbi:MAG: hypothetical protein IPK83_22505 [Planctomycetes bacterium]|nr:hypothetical protein [Planctomycetota bacterium]